MFYLSQTLESLKTKVETSTGGKHDPQLVQKAKYLKALIEAVRINDSVDGIRQSERHLKIKIDALKVLGEELKDQKYIDQAIDVLDNYLIKFTQNKNK